MGIYIFNEATHNNVVVVSFEYIVNGTGSCYRSKGTALEKETKKSLEEMEILVL